MRLIAFLIVIVGIALAGGSVFFASERFRAIEANLAKTRTDAAVAPQIETVQVVVAARPLKFGNVLQKEFVKLSEWPKGSAPPTGFSDLDMLFGDGTEPRTVLAPMQEGEPILQGKITGFGERPSISARLSEGMRAFSIPISSVSGVSGFVLPGDRVDIFLTRSSEGGLVTDVILQNILVIAVDQLADENANKPKVGRTATVEVDPETAQKLALAQRLGSLSLSLRKVGAQDTTEDMRVSIGDILNDEDGDTGRSTKTTQVRVRRGNEVQTLNFGE